ncbi:MAG: DNA methyltransferase [Albidovulum sp.]
MPDRKFPFPKSLYAVEDALRFFVNDKRNAVVLDFFAGSGTTAHAVMRLNRQDGGRRQCICVTNNEVAADEQKALRKMACVRATRNGNSGASATTSPSRGLPPPSPARRRTASPSRATTSSPTSSRWPKASRRTPSSSP